MIAGNRRLISPRRWHPPATATLPVSSAPLASVRLIATGHGPEDVTFDGDGRAVFGLADGSVVRLNLTTSEQTVLANTGGRPLGVDCCADGSVLVCDHDRGLLRVDADGRVEVLVDRIDGERIRFASNVTHRADGTIWFTTSTSRWDLDHYLGDIVEHACTGKLVRVDPDGTLTVLRRDLAFGNGVVLDGDALYYAETAAYRVNRLDLATGVTTKHVDGLPGFPDNMSLGSDGLLWIAMAAPRDRNLDVLLPLPGVLRQAMWLLPERLRPEAKPVTWVLAVDAAGQVVRDLRGEDVDYGFVTGVAERDGTLVLAGLHADGLLVSEV